MTHLPMICFTNVFVSKTVHSFSKVQMEILLIATVILVVAAISWVFFSSNNSSDYISCFASISESKNSRPVVTISAHGVLFDNHCQLLPGVAQTLGPISQYLTIYVFVQVPSASHVESAAKLSHRALVGLVDSDNILFCQTGVGRTAMARQLESSLHIEGDREVAGLSAIFCPTALIGGICHNAHFTANTFESLFQLHGYEIACVLARKP